MVKYPVKNMENMHEQKLEKSRKQILLGTRRNAVLLTLGFQFGKTCF